MQSTRGLSRCYEGQAMSMKKVITYMLLADHRINPKSFCKRNSKYVDSTRY